MKRIQYLSPFILVLLLIASISCSAGFSDLFENVTMRIDYFHIGNAHEEIIALDKVYRQGVWAGSRTNLVDEFDLGRYYARIYDVSSGRLIFSRGFDSYFGEYRTTTPAIAGTKRTFHESVLIPYPKNNIRFVLDKRMPDNTFQPLFDKEIDPNDASTARTSPTPSASVIPVIENGPPAKKVDIAIIAEGYAAGEIDEFKKDLQRYTDILFRWEPYASTKDRFNVRGVFLASADSGCSEPEKGIFKSTAIGSSFNSLNIDRYLLTEDNRALRDVAAAAPYDALIIIVNHTRYGGGGIYNQYSISTSDGDWGEHVFHHEFGHSFGGLGDEYYAADVAYNDFYPKGIEPREPNLTVLLDPSKLKWLDLATPGVAIPTPWEKEEFDGLYLEDQRLRKEMDSELEKNRKAGADDQELHELRNSYKLRRDELNEKMKAILLHSPNRGIVGAFEGAGFSSKGIYRPMLNCVMLKYLEEDKAFCRVCEQAIRRIVRHYSD